MNTNNDSKSIQQIIKSRRSIRSFSKGSVPLEEVNEILKSAMYAPYAAAATGLPITEVRKVFAIKIGTYSMEMAKSILLSKIASLAKKMDIALKIFPFLKKKMGAFSSRLKAITSNGIFSLDNGDYFIIVAERKGFPLNVKQSLSFAMQNMWLSATSYNVAFQLLAVTGILSNDKRFLDLIKLPKNTYQLDGCVIGIANEHPDIKKEIAIDEFVTWIS
jgi:nitroreductase